MAVGSPWITINGVGYPDVTPNGGCQGAIYLAVVLDRQTLQEKTTAPESSPMCLANAAALKTYLISLTGNDLVVVGSNWLEGVDAGLDLTSIGVGSFSASQPGNEYYPAGIIAIGSPGATVGSAFFNYESSDGSIERFNVYATGTLQEDAYGNYNYYSSDVPEFAISPNDPGILNSSNTGQSAISVSAMLSTNGVLQNVYTSPQGQTNGYWLLTLSRNTMDTNGYSCPQGPRSTDGTIQYIPSCGLFFNTGSSDPTTSKTAYMALASALNSINSWQLAFLTTVGQPTSATSMWQVAGFNQATDYSNNNSNGFLEFSQALSTIGGTPNLIQSLYQTGSTYTFVGSSGLEGPLTGAAVESTSALAAQGQTGFVHGILQRNSNGLFQPHQSNQEPASVFAAKGGFNDPEFKLTETVLQQPVDWPSSSTTTLINQACGTCSYGADTLAGQLSAYRYISYYLLAYYYMQGVPAVNSHLDDIHYFFTGSYNTSIDYHTFDPANVQAPMDAGYTGIYHCDSVANVVDRYGNPVKQCTISNFQPDGLTLVFNDTDFDAVRRQMHNEVVYLTNTLQFLITGSNSMKSVIDSGSSNVGLALTGAAANVLGSDLVAPPPQTVVTTSWQSIVQLIGGASSILSLVPGLEPLAPALGIVTKLAGGISSVTGGAMVISADRGGITSTTTTKSLPSAFSTFADTISNLANGELQDQLGGGFDAMVDSVTSDWGRLSTIGPMTADPSNLVFFAPNQASQLIAIRSISLAASRQFYMSLMPAMGYSIDYYPSVAGYISGQSNKVTMPDMGNYYTGDSTEYCSAFYLNPQQNNPTSLTGLGSPTPYSYIWYPTIAGEENTFRYSGAGIIFSAYGESATATTTAVNMYVIGGKVGYPNTATPAIGVASAQLGSYLFTSAGLNLPIDEFVTPNGPMASVFSDASSKNRAGIDAGSICTAQLYPNQDSLNAVAGVPDSSNATTTTLTAPASSILGDDLAVSATVLAGSTPVTTGSVYFVVDNTGSVNANVNAQGVASTSIPSSLLARGSHQIVAKYSRVAPYLPSMSSIVTINVYTTAQDLSLSASANSMSVSYGATSSPITLQLISISGMSGTVNLTCSGLPVGMTCSFNPAQVNLASAGQASATFAINGGSASKSSLWIPGIGLLLLPVSLASLGRIRKGAFRISSLACLAIITILGASSFSGCSGRSSPSSNAFQESGTKTVIINATIGSVTRTIPIQVTIQ